MFGVFTTAASQPNAGAQPHRLAEMPGAGGRGRVEHMQLPLQGVEAHFAVVPYYVAQHMHVSSGTPSPVYIKASLQCGLGTAICL